MQQNDLFQKKSASPTPITRPKRRKKRYNQQLQLNTMERLQADAIVLAEACRLPPFKLLAERAHVRNRYGICFDDGTIKIRLYDLRSGKLLRYSSLIDTLCHELAHLRHMNHGIRFQNLYRRILEHARKLDIYQPRQTSQQLHFLGLDNNRNASCDGYYNHNVSCDGFLNSRKNLPNT